MGAGWDNRHYSKGKLCSDCGTPVCNTSMGRCKPCHGRSMRPTVGRPYTDGNGYIRIRSSWDHPNANASGELLEHVKVMAEMIGRPLRKGENVHHKNGVRNDNRPENLELWLVSQPKGQRVVDLVEWAHEILATYDAEVCGWHGRLSIEPERMSIVRGV